MRFPLGWRGWFVGFVWRKMILPLCKKIGFVLYFFLAVQYFYSFPIFRFKICIHIFLIFALSCSHVLPIHFLCLSLPPSTISCLYRRFYENSWDDEFTSRLRRTLLQPRSRKKRISASTLIITKIAFIGRTCEYKINKLLGAKNHISQMGKCQVFWHCMAIGSYKSYEILMSCWQRLENIEKSEKDEMVIGKRKKTIRNSKIICLLSVLILMNIFIHILFVVEWKIM